MSYGLEFFWIKVLKYNQYETALQNLNNGKIEVIESPNPSLIENHIIVNTNVSLISAGTEKMLLNFGNSNFIDKARQQPEKVIQVLDKAKSDGILSTYEAVQSKLKEPIPLGYSSVEES